MKDKAVVLFAVLVAVSSVIGCGTSTEVHGSDWLVPVSELDCLGIHVAGEQIFVDGQACDSTAGMMDAVRGYADALAYRGIMLTYPDKRSPNVDLRELSRYCRANGIDLFSGYQSAIVSPGEYAVHIIAGTRWRGGPPHDHVRDTESELGQRKAGKHTAKTRSPITQSLNHQFTQFP